MLLPPRRSEVAIEQRRQVPGDPRGDVHAVGDGAHRPFGFVQAGPDRRPHLARDVAVQLADRVHLAGGPDRQRGHVELGTAGARVLAEREEAGAVLAERPPAAGQVLLDELEGERVVARRHRRVRREDRRLAHFREGRVERDAALQEIPDPLEDDEGGVAFVQVVDGRVRAERAQRAHAADAEHDLLLDAGLAVAAVEARRQLAVPRRVLLEVGVEQVQLHAAHAHAPDRHEHRAIAERDGRHARPAVRRHRRLDRGVGPVQPLVALLLPALRRHALVEVALGIHEADADERHAEVARFLAVVAGEHAQAARVDRQRLVERELGGEICDAVPVRAVVPAAPPGVAGLARRFEIRDRPVVEGQELRRPGRRLQPVPRDHAQHADRVVLGAAPERVVELPEDLAGTRVPDPPQVDGQILETSDPIGQGRQFSVAFGDHAEVRIVPMRTRRRSTRTSAGRCCRRRRWRPLCRCRPGR